MAKQQLYWHFLPADRRLQFGDGRRIVKGRTLKVDSKPILCRQGLHASKRAIDALQWASGPIICRVTLGGTVLHDGDKSVGTERTVLWWAALLSAMLVVGFGMGRGNVGGMAWALAVLAMIVNPLWVIYRLIRGSLACIDGRRMPV